MTAPEATRAAAGRIVRDLDLVHPTALSVMTEPEREAFTVVRFVCAEIQDGDRATR